MRCGTMSSSFTDSLPLPSPFQENKAVPLLPGFSASSELSGALHTLENLFALATPPASVPSPKGRRVWKEGRAVAQTEESYFPELFKSKGRRGPKSCGKYRQESWRFGVRFRRERKDKRTEKGWLQASGQGRRNNLSKKAGNQKIHSWQLHFACICGWSKQLGGKKQQQQHKKKKKLKQVYILIAVQEGAKRLLRDGRKATWGKEKRPVLSLLSPCSVWAKEKPKWHFLSC